MRTCEPATFSPIYGLDSSKPGFAAARTSQRSLLAHIRRRPGAPAQCQSLGWNGYQLEP